MNEAKILNAIADTMTCDKCPSPCKAKQNASKASCVQQWSETLSKINPNANWKEVCYEVSEMQRPKRGKWIRDGHHIRCDQCGMYMCDTDREGDRIPTEFCPHCGADMRGEQDE